MSAAKEKFVAAAENGQINLVTEYLQKGNVYVDCKNKDDYTALMEAAMNGRKVRLIHHSLTHLLAFSPRYLLTH